MPLFDKKPEIPRSQFKDILKKSNFKIDQSKPLSDRQRSLIERKDFPRKLGSTISKSEYERTVRDLEKTKREETDFSKRYKINKEIKFLKELENKGDSAK
jgi:hypothetical protein